MKEMQAAAGRRSEPAIRNALVGNRSALAGFRLVVLALGLVAIAVAGAASAFAQDPAAALAAAQGGVPNVGRLGVELVSLAVVVAVVESALTAIFQWRVYRMVFNNRAMKTVVMVAVGLMIVLGFRYDIFARIMAIVTPGSTVESWSGKVSAALSALIIAGGSAGVNTLLQRMGIRNPVQPEAERPALRNDEAWISIKVTRRSAVGPISYRIARVGSRCRNAAACGTIEESNFLDRLKEAFIANSMRFPSYGGRTVKVDRAYEISAIGVRNVQRDGATERETFSETIYRGSFAPRAIVDFKVTI